MDEKYSRIYYWALMPTMSDPDVYVSIYLASDNSFIEALSWIREYIIYNEVFIYKWT
jgi:hypothetical protein